MAPIQTNSKSRPKHSTTRRKTIAQNGSSEGDQSPRDSMLSTAAA
jgi:hypothetical protein